MRAATSFIVTAVISAAIHSQLTGCLFGGLGDNCNCPTFPELPEPQAALLIDEVSAWTVAGNDDTLPADPRGGTVDVTKDRLVIRYEHDGMSREVVYAVEPLR